VQPTSSTATGDLVNGYRVVGKLGAGGMGVVYKATDPRLDRTVALKFLPPEIEANEQARSQLLREARAASSLDHPNVGAIYAIEETPDGRSFLVLAYYEGETLAQRLTRGPLPAAQALDIARQIALGLEEAHAHGIVHRDVKPPNVILTRQGIVKIVDFGLARAIQSADSTASANVAGTVSYMSPEQALGRPLDQRTDLWAAGVVLLRMLTGHLPFDAESVPAKLLAIAQSAPAHLDELPPELRAVVCRTLAKDPAERYQTAAELALDLSRLQRWKEGGEATSTIGAGALRRYEESASRPALGPPATRTRSRLLIAAAVLIAAAALAVPLARQRLFAPAGPAEKHIAVLPFTVHGVSEGGEALADGVMETLTGRLSNLETGARSLWVIPASEVRSRKVGDAATALKTLGATLAITGSIERSGKAVRLVANLVDTRRMAQLGSAEVDQRNGDFSEAEDVAVRKLAALMNVAVPEAARGPARGSSAPAAYELYLQARGLMARWDKAGNLDRAVSLLREATAADPSFALAFASLGEAYLLRYRTDHDPRWLDPAAAACEQAVRLNQGLAPVYVTLGRIHMDTARTDLALEEFQHALQLDPRDADALMGLSSVYETQARYTDAEQVLTRAAALRPDYWVGHSRLAGFYFAQRRYPEAVAQFQKVVELTPDNAVGWLNLGTALRAAGRLAEAETALNRSIGISPSYGALTNLGNIFYQQRRYADAAQRYQKALELNDKDYRPWNALANAYLWLGRSTDAKDCYRRALPIIEKDASLHPTDAGLQARLGLAYIRNQDRTRASSHIRAALALAPKDPEVLSAMAEVYEIVGERREAIVWLRKAVAAGQSMDNLYNDTVLHKVVEDPTFSPK
jgi:serine/threonine-protein kinase